MPIEHSSALTRAQGGMPIEHPSAFTHARSRMPLERPSALTHNQSENPLEYPTAPKVDRGKTEELTKILLETLFSDGFIMEREEKQVFLYAKCGGDHVTPIGMACQLDKFAPILGPKEIWDATLSELNDIRQLLHIFPVRHQLPGFVNFVEKSTSFHSTFFLRQEKIDPSTGKLEAMLSEEGDAAILRYTSGEGHPSARLNLMLALDVVQYDEDMTRFANLLQRSIHAQTPKYSGKLFRGSLNSPLEVFMMFLKERFYLPPFVSTTDEPEQIFFSEWSDEKRKSARGRPVALHNVVFEIDTKGHPLTNTRTKAHQRKEWVLPEITLSSYNIYRFSG